MAQNLYVELARAHLSLNPTKAIFARFVIDGSAPQLTWIAIAVEKVFPNEPERLARMSLIQGLLSLRYKICIDTVIEGEPQYVRMAHLACIGAL